VSAVIHDVEIRQEYYIEQYYNSVVKEDHSKINSDNLQSPTSNGTTISGSNCLQNKFIPLDKIKKKLTAEFIMTQTQVLEMIGYNFSFHTPFDCIKQFEKEYWNDVHAKLEKMENTKHASNEARS
jgi:hypothetical protein